VDIFCTSNFEQLGHFAAKGLGFFALKEVEIVLLQFKAHQMQNIMKQRDYW
jgi:hypothetical protein